ncbi:hypothetical protein [Streptomyces sp. DSM 40750]|uniref:hypothetical protein n=1 Tax=Streptomyces sp. DSM 40750 TaxID=2801030 RepID=UPI00214B5536|nr:hypothetical protein [Streptomyces sp. DSM 40750]UUU21549.1 hypothetical protein JIX55_15150 [Streptomyces sp. DSM 40750]
MRMWKPLVVIATALATPLSVLAPTASAENANGDKYTHPTTLTRASCMIHANYPKAGIPDWGWTKQQRSPRGKAYKVGVRYTYKNYALVFDYAKAGEPSWGFIAKSCLADPRAYNKHGQPLPDQRGVGGSGKSKDVVMSAPHAGKSKRTVLHVGSNHVGTLRNAPKSFVIGNVRAGDPFHITTERCGTHNRKSWILGYAPHSGRWGYVQAQHLPACH